MTSEGTVEEPGDEVRYKREFGGTGSRGKMEQDRGRDTGGQSSGTN